MNETPTLHPGLQNHPYKREVSSMLTTLRKYGIKVKSVNDGEMTISVNAVPALHTILSVDECYVYVTCPDTDERKWLRVLLGNSPGDLVCDYSAGSPVLDAAMQEHYDRWLR